MSWLLIAGGLGLSLVVTGFVVADILRHGGGRRQLLGWATGMAIASFGSVLLATGFQQSLISLYLSVTGATGGTATRPPTPRVVAGLIWGIGVLISVLAVSVYITRVRRRSTR